MKKDKTVNQFLEELKKVPIITNACRAVGVSRQTVYRWKSEDVTFQSKVDSAMAEGIAYMNDMSESQLLVLVQEKKWPALQFWLKNHHPTYKTMYFDRHKAYDDELKRKHEVIDPETQKAIKAMQERFMKVKRESDCKRDEYIAAVNKASKPKRKIVIKRRKSSQPHQTGK